VFPANLSYDENAKRLLKTSNLSEFLQKAYIVDTQRGAVLVEPEMRPRRRGDTEPSTLNQTTWKSCTLLPVPPPPAEEDPDWGLGDERAQVGYLECTWKGKTRGGGSGEDERNSNPKNIKVYTFFWLTGKWLEAAQEIAEETTKEGKRKRATSAGLALNKPSAALYIVLPADYRPIKLSDSQRLNCLR